MNQISSNSHATTEHRKRIHEYSVAVNEGSLDKDIKLIKEGKDIDSITLRNLFKAHLLRRDSKENKNIFELLMDNAHLEKSKNSFGVLLAQCLPTITHEEFSSMIQYAIEHTKKPEQFLEKIFELGGSPNCYYNFQNSNTNNTIISGTPLHQAISRKDTNFETVLCLLKNKAVLDCKAEQNNVPFDYLSFDKADKKFKAFLDYTKTLPETSDIKTVLHHVCLKNGHTDFAKEIQDSGLKINPAIIARVDMNIYAELRKMEFPQLFKTSLNQREINL